MRKSILFSFLFLGLFAIFSLSGWGQEYRVKKIIGSLIAFPNGITVDVQGNIYITQYNSIIKLNSKGELITQFVAPTAGQFLASGADIALDSQGSIYMADANNGHILKFDATGKFITKFGSYGTGDGQFYNVCSIALDSQENIYVADYGHNRIQKFDATGKFLMKFGSKGTADGQFNSCENITVDNQGNIYVADIGNHRIQKFDSQGNFILTIGAYGKADGQFDKPKGIVVDSQGNIYVADSNNSRIQKFDATGKFLMKFGSKGIADGQFRMTPYGITLDKQGNIYVGSHSEIQKFDPAGNFLIKFGSSGLNDGEINHPKAITVGRQGEIYVADTYNSRIQKFDATGKFLMKFGSHGTGDGQFDRPSGICLDNRANIYIADEGNSRIQKFDATGKFLMKFGSKGKADGQFDFPEKIVIDNQGNIYVTDQNNSRVQKFDATGKFLMKFGSKGIADGQFSAPNGIALDGQNNSYVTDFSNYNVQKFDATGKFLMKFGSSGITDGKLRAPSDVALDSQGNIYVADHRIQKFDVAGKFVSVVGLPLQYSSIAIERRTNILYATAEFALIIYESTGNWCSISGRIFSDDDQNCSMDANEKPIPNVIVMAKPGNYYGVSNDMGQYEMVVDTGTYTVTQIIQNSSTKLIQSICPAQNVYSSVKLKVKGDSITNLNFADKITLLSNLSSNIRSDRRRRCFLSITTVNYSNTGYGDAQNVKVYVKLPKYVVLKSADKPYVVDKDSNYVFTIGTLKAGESGKIQIKDSVVCQRGITGLTVCTKAWITPANTVTPKPTWDQSDITLSGRCIENGRVRFVLTNSGQGSMADSSEFRVFLDAQLALRKNFKLAKGDSLVLRVPANGKTVRLEVNQRPDHPRKSQSNLTLEGCVASASEKPSTGFVNVLPQDDVEPEVAIECLPIIDSYDPNDKQVSPIGTTTQHYTPTTASLKYLIRFQNTGSDTAYTVVLVDTLSNKLDMATLEVQGSSHPYKLGVSGKGRPVLTFTFNNINLPDSTRNQLGSNGFIQFSIKPLAGLAEKTLIENFADIYFDYNDPIRTNTTTNRIYDVPPVVDVANALPVNEVVLRKPQIATLGAALVEGKTTITIDGNYFEKVAAKNIVSINGIQATVIEASEGKLVVTIPTPKDPISGKVTVRTDGGEAVSELELVLASEAEVALQGVRLYPNPSSGLLIIDFIQTQERVSKVVVYNSVGKQVLVHIPQRTAQRVSELDLSGYGVGMYLISIQAGDKQLTRKMVIRY